MAAAANQEDQLFIKVRGDCAALGSSWQPRFYQTCGILLASLGATLKNVFGHDKANVATALIAATIDESAEAVRGEVDAHKKTWLAKPGDERDTLNAQAAVWATRHPGHRVDCPACTSQALV